MKHKPFQFTVNPDFAPTSLAGWHIFNTWLQRSLDTRIHLDIYQDFASQRQAIRNDAIDLIFANPYDASMLIREKGFHCLARPGGRSDEVVIAVRGDHPASTVEGLEAGMRLASTDDPDVHMMRCTHDGNDHVGTGKYQCRQHRTPHLQQLCLGCQGAPFCSK